MDNLRAKIEKVIEKRNKSIELDTKLTIIDLQISLWKTVDGPWYVTNQQIQKDIRWDGNLFSVIKRKAKKIIIRTAAM